MLLTDEERERFATWLEEQAEVSRNAIERLSSLGPHAEIAAQIAQREAAAALLIAKKLRSTETSNCFVT